MVYTCIVIDDEPHAAEHLIECINEIQTLKLIKSYTDSATALEEILEMKGKVDILFTDVEMPNLSGLALAEKLKDKVKFLIFVSGHMEYAISGYSLEVKDFLLKPFTFKTFEKIVSSAINKLAIEPSFISLKTKEDKALIKIYVEEILYIEAKGNYIQIYTGEKLPIMISNLSDVEEKLKQYPIFIKIHKSYLVSLKHIEKFKDDFICLRNGVTLSVGHTYKNELTAYFMAE